jgi:nucleotide-binding universal stress UspA family protein
MKTIICPVDFSDVSRNAVQYADALANHFDSTLIFVHAFHYPVIMPENAAILDSNSLLMKEEEARDKMQSLCQLLKRSRSYSKVNYEYKLIYGFVGDELPRYAHDRKADLIVMGTSGAEGIKKALIGTMAASFIDKTTAPVLIVPSEVKYHEIKEIVYTSDMKNDNKEELKKLLDIAGSYNAHISFVSFIDGAQKPADQKEMEEYIKSGLLNNKYSDVSCEVLKQDHLMRDITQYVTHKKADLMVMTRRQRNFFQRLWEKSITHEMAYASLLPVLIYHNAAN